MKNRLLKSLRSHRASVCSIDNSHLYIVDWKNINNGNVTISSYKEDSVNAVHLENNKNIEVFFYGFSDNSLPITRSCYSKQCECVLFPVCCDQDEWVLFIETKYAADLSHAQHKKANYPFKMVNQIKETVQYFRNKKIIADDKVVHAIISFPNLMVAFDSWAFPIYDDNGNEESVLDILQNDKIIIRATNNAQILDERNILLIGME